ncbi:MAG: tetratricopeptide repeat protein [Nitrospirae bacterium]|nr:MAG: tetratricopeptide repeat protein [Nitrospirota bacterium]
MTRDPFFSMIVPSYKDPTKRMLSFLSLVYLLGLRADCSPYRFVLLSGLFAGVLALRMMGPVLAQPVPDDTGTPAREQESVNPENEAVAHNRLGVDFFLTNELDVAIDEFREAIRLRPGYVDAYANLGVALAKQGDLTGALAAWSHVQRLEPDRMPVQYHISALVAFNYGISLLREGRIKDAMAEWRTALRIQPNFAEAQYALGMGYLIQGQAAQALASFNEARTLRPDWVAAHTQAGVAAYELHEWAEAERAWQEALAEQPDHAPAYVNLAVMRLAEGNAAEAAVLCRRALELDSHLVQAQFNLGLAFLNQGKIDEAIEALQQSLALEPSLVRAHVALGQAWMAKGEWAKALRAWRIALRSMPPDDSRASDLLYHSGLASLLLGDLHGAASLFQQALEGRSEWGAAWYQYGVALTGLRRWSEAVRAFERVVEAAPLWPQGWFALGKARYHYGDADGAIASMRRAVQQDGEFVEAAFALGVMLRSLGRFPEAFIAVRHAAERGLPEAQELLATMYANGSGVSRDMSEALLWWFRAMKSGAPESARLAAARLSDSRRRVYKGLASDAELLEIQQGFEAIRNELRRGAAHRYSRFSADGFDPRWAGNRLHPGVPILIDLALALDERAHEQLETLFLRGQRGVVAPYNPRILAYLLETAREGFARSCRVLHVSRIREHVDDQRWHEIQDILRQCRDSSIGRT